MCRGLFLTLRTMKLQYLTIVLLPINLKGRTMLTQEEIKKQLAKMEEPYIYIDSAYIRKGKPMHQLYNQSHKRRIKISKESLFNISIDATFNLIQELIKEHHTKTKGHLGIFGKIRFYYYKHWNGSIYGFDKYGKCL